MLKIFSRRVNGQGQMNVNTFGMHSDLWNPGYHLCENKIKAQRSKKNIRNAKAFRCNTE